MVVSGWPRPPSDGGLTDGFCALSYRDLEGAVASACRTLDGCAARTRGRIAIPCDNDVRTVVALLACLEVGLDVELTPASAAASRDCWGIVRAASTTSEIAIEANPGFAAPAERAHGVAVATSGSTGAPKRVLYRHRDLVANARGCVERLGLTAADRVAIPVPTFHMYGLGAALLPALIAGASVDLQPRANAMRFVARERAFAPTVAFLTPGFAQGLLAARHGTRAYRATVLAGDWMPASAFAAYEERHGPVVALYGTTELGAVAAASPGNRLAERVEGAGRALPGVDVELRTTRGRDELFVRRADGFRGYLDAEGRFSPAELDAGFWATRDHAELLNGDRLRLLGRADDAVKRDGRLVRLGEVEAVLLEIPGVERAAVIKQGVTPRGEGLIAFVAARSGSRFDEAEARQAARERLAGHAVPDRFVMLRNLPTLASGKIDREALRAEAARA